MIGQPNNPYTHNSKAVYVSPELKIYGTVTDLTHAGVETNDDGAGGSDLAFSDTLPPTGIN
jgi:hypothetical protein